MIRFVSSTLVNLLLHLLDLLYFKKKMTAKIQLSGVSEIV